MATRSPPTSNANSAVPQPLVRSRASSEKQGNSSRPNSFKPDRKHSGFFQFFEPKLVHRNGSRTTEPDFRRRSFTVNLSLFVYDFVRGIFGARKRTSACTTVRPTLW